MKNTFFVVLAVIAALFLAPSEVQAAKNKKASKSETRLVPWLDTLGVPSSKEDREGYAVIYKVENYDRLTDKNNELLDKMKANPAPLLEIKKQKQIARGIKKKELVTVMRALGLDTSVENRAQLAVDNGVVAKTEDYKKTGDQNVKLLEKILQNHVSAPVALKKIELPADDMPPLPTGGATVDPASVNETLSLFAGSYIGNVESTLKEIDLYLAGSPDVDLFTEYLFDQEKSVMDIPPASGFTLVTKKTPPAKIAASASPSSAPKVTDGNTGNTENQNKGWGLQKLLYGLMGVIFLISTGVSAVYLCKLYKSGYLSRPRLVAYSSDEEDLVSSQSDGIEDLPILEESHREAALQFVVKNGSIKQLNRLRPLRKPELDYIMTNIVNTEHEQKIRAVLDT